MEREGFIGQYVDGWYVLDFEGTLKHGHKTYSCRHECGFERKWRKGELLNNKAKCSNCVQVVLDEGVSYLPEGFNEEKPQDMLEDYKEKCLKIWAEPKEQEIDIKLLQVMLKQNICDTALLDQYKRKVFYGKDMDRDIVGTSTDTLEHCLSAGPVKCNDVYKPSKKTKIDLKLIHGMLGIIGESGELATTLSKGLTQNKFTEDDKVNILEECGDVLYFLTVLINDMGFTFEQVFAKNVAKLEKRYGGSFSHDKAVNRDLAGEQEVLKK
jgi:NTP pyrophosphatase (non-canonical NTP hydrolase)